MSENTRTTIEFRQRNKIIVILVFALYPIIALPLILVEISNKRKYAFTLLAIFLGFMGLLYPPFGDFYRYTEDYSRYASCSFSELMELTSLNMDILFPIFLWALGKLGIPCDYGRFITTFISFQLLLSIIYDIVKGAQISRMKVLFIVLSFLCFSPFHNFIARFSFSGALFIYASYRLIVNKRKRAIILLILSVLNHFSYIVPAVLLILYWLIKLPVSRSTILWTVLLSFVFSFDFFTPLISMLPLDTYVVDHLFEYVDGYWANEYVSEGSLRFRILSVISKAGFYYCWLFIYWRFRNTEWVRYIEYFLVLLLICSPFKGIYGRYFFIASLIMVIEVLSYFADYGMKKRTWTTFGIVCAFMLLINVWGIRRQLSISHERLIMAPTFMIVTHTYDQTWVNRTLDSDGLLPN